MEATLRDISSGFTTLFAVTVMLSMGLALSAREVIKPLRDYRLVLGALIANFVAVPLAALLIAELLGLSEDLRIGLLLVSVAAGAPLLPKLAQMADAHVPSAVAIVLLLVVATIGYMPIVLPIVLPDVQIDAAGIATTLLLQLLLPLGIGLLVRARYRDFAKAVQLRVGLLANIALVVMLLLVLGLNLGDVIDLFGSGSITAVLLLIAVALGAGYVLGGSEEQTRRVVALGTGQRNLAAAFVVGAASFQDRPDVMALLATAGLLGMVTVIPLAIAIGKLPGEQEAPAPTQSVQPLTTVAPRHRRRPQPRRRRRKRRSSPGLVRRRK